MTALLTEILGGDLRSLRRALDTILTTRPELKDALAPLKEAARTYRLDELARLLGEEDQ